MPRRVDKAGKIGHLPVSRDAEMDVGRESSIPRLKEFQVQSSCVPMTPMQPIVQRPQPTGTERREDQLGQENKLLQETQAHRVAAYCESLKSIDIDQGFANWEANLSRISGDVQYRSQFFMEANRLESGPFTNLRTLEHIEKNSACATQKGNVNAASSSAVPVSDSTCDDNQLEATSTTFLAANEGNSLVSNLQSYSSHAFGYPQFKFQKPKLNFWLDIVFHGTILIIFTWISLRTIFFKKKKKKFTSLCKVQGENRTNNFWSVLCELY